MPGLLAVGAPYVVEAFVPRIGARAMGYYVSALVAGGLVGRLGVALASAVVGWRVAIGLLAVLPLAAVIAMRRGLPEPELPPRGGGWRRHLTNVRLLGVSVGGGALFFTFVGTFTYVTYRLEEPPFSYSVAAASLVFLLWLTGLAGPLAGRLADRVGWRRLALGTVALSAAGVLLTLPDVLPLLVLGLALHRRRDVHGLHGDAARRQRRGAGRPRRRDGPLLQHLLRGRGARRLPPGLAWQEWGWGGVAAAGLVALGLAAAGIASVRDRDELERRRTTALTLPEPSRLARPLAVLRCPA